MAIFVVLLAVSAFFLSRHIRRDPARARRVWDDVRREARDSFPRPMRPMALACLAAVVGMIVLNHGRWSSVVLALATLAFVAFGLAWLREFRYLINLTDDVFPGRNDKLIWGILLIVLPPVGVWLFRSYRMAHWPEAKAAKASGFDEYF
ncbi:MAG: hypothetical protein U0800_25455 [Isosphaeraceae bacterium]